MALSKASIAVQFAGGIETKQDDKSVPSTKLLVLQNAVFTKAISLSKRAGYAALPTAVLGTATPYDSAKALAVRGTELLLLTNDRCYSYIESAGAWSDAGVVQSVSQSDRAIAKAPATQTSGDYAACNGIGVAAWEDSRGGVYWCVIEDDGGRIVQAVSQASSTGSRPRCVRVGSKLAVLWAEAVLGQIKIVIIDPASPHTYNATLFPNILVSDLMVAQPNYDAAYVGDNTSGATFRNAACITWNSPTGIRAGWLDPSGVIGSPGTGWPSPDTLVPAAAVTYGPVIEPLPWFQDLWFVAWGTAANAYLTYATGYSATVDLQSETALTVASASMIAIACRTTESVTVPGTLDEVVDCWIETRASPNRLSTVVLRTYNVTTAGVSSGTTIRGACLASKGFSDRAGGFEAYGVTHERPYANSYVSIVHDVPIFGVYLTVRFDGVVVARTLPSIAGDAPARSHLPSILDGGARSLRWVAGAKAQLDGINGDIFTEQGLRLVALDFGDDDSHQTAEAGASLYLGGACPHVYDGRAWAEHGFHYGIDWETSETLHVNSTAGSGGMLNGTYAYVFVPEFTLANGEIVLGPPSKPYEVEVTGSDDRITLSIPPINITAMTGSADARIGVFRSTDGNGDEFFRCSSLDPSATGANGYVTNTTSSDSVTFIDDYSDETLLTKEPLYTNGGILENDPSTSGGLLVGGKGRLFTNDPSDGNLVRFSQERADGRAIECPDGLGIKVPDEGGPVTALGVLDDALIIFKRAAVYFVVGPGPLANPDQGGFSPPIRIPGDAGCTDPKSIVATPAGLMYKSAKGIWIVDNSRQMSYVGAPVEAFNDQDVTRATLIENSTQVRFLTADGSTLLYDYLFGQWSTFTNHEGADAVELNGTYQYLRNDGQVYAESATYTDNGAAISMVIQTAWIHLQETLQGLQRIWHLLILGSRKSQHALRVRYRTDYGAGWSPPFYFNSASAGGSAYGEGVYGDGVYGGSDPTLYQFRAHIGAKCEAIQFEFADVERRNYIRVEEVNAFTVTRLAVVTTVTVNPGSYTSTEIDTVISAQLPALVTLAFSAAGVATFTSVDESIAISWTTTELRNSLGFDGTEATALTVVGSAIPEYAPAESPGASFELTELLITGGVKGPANKVPASRSG